MANSTKRDIQEDRDNQRALKKANQTKPVSTAPPPPPAEPQKGEQTQKAVEEKTEIFKADPIKSPVLAKALEMQHRKEQSKEKPNQQQIPYYDNSIDKLETLMLNKINNEITSPERPKPKADVISDEIEADWRELKKLEVTEKRVSNPVLPKPQMKG